MTHPLYILILLLVFAGAGRRHLRHTLHIVDNNRLTADWSTTDWSSIGNEEEYPVVLVHCDSHTFRIEKPRISDQRLLNFTRVETFGSPDVHWVRASVDTRDPEVFTSQPEIVEKNLATP